MVFHTYLQIANFIVLYPGHEDMFKSLKDNVTKSPYLRDFIVFDEDGHTVWLTWWEKAAI